MDLTDANVNTVFEDCLYSDEEVIAHGRAEIVKKALIVDGMIAKLAFNPEKIEKRREDIKSMLAELPDEFMYSKGGGYTFLAACNDRHGNQWTNLHKVMDELFMLGQAIKCARYSFPRDFWRALPGGFPYYSISFDGFPTKTG